MRTARCVWDIPPEPLQRQRLFRASSSANCRRRPRFGFRVGAVRRSRAAEKTQSGLTFAEAPTMLIRLALRGYPDRPLCETPSPGGVH